MILDLKAKALIAGLVLASTAFATYKTTAWFYDAKISKIEKDAAEAQTKAVKTARSEEQKVANGYQDALNEARTRNKALQDAADTARRERDGLLHTLFTAERRFASASQATLIEYSTALSTVHGECSKRYTELAVKAEGHVSDLRTVLEAWPKWERQE